MSRWGGKRTFSRLICRMRTISLLNSSFFICPKKYSLMPSYDENNVIRLSWRGCDDVTKIHLMMCTYHPCFVIFRFSNFKDYKDYIIIFLVTFCIFYLLMHVAASWAENVKNVNRIHLHVVHVTALAPKIKESWRFFSIKHRIVPFAKCPHCRQRCMPSLQSCRTRRQWICPLPCTGCPRSKEELNPMKHTRNTARFVLSLRTNDLTTPSMLFYST